jgi:peptidoglycan/LPS O-acetylase OafA/YrhL
VNGTEENPRDLERVPALDGLRGLAIIAVLAFHSGYRVARGGFLGVSLFFTISGYLITTLLVDEHHRQARIDLRGFWERRFRRLAPAAILALSGIMIAARQFADPSQRASLQADALSALGYVANWRFLAHGQSYADLFRTPSPVLHFWSLAIEEQFYIVFPIVVAVVMRRSRSADRALLATLVALGAGSLAIQLTASSFDRVYYGTDTRLFEIVAGAMLATVTYRHRDAFARFRVGATVLGLLAFASFVGLVATVPLGASWLAHGGLALVALLNVGLVVSALAPGPWSTALASRPLAGIGRVSYGLYLFHWPVFLWLDERRTGLTGVALLAARLAVVVPLTIASYHLVECPVRFGRRLPGRRRFATMLACTLTAAIVLALALPTAVVPSLTDTRALAAVLSKPATRSNPLRVMVVGDSTGTSVVRGIAASHDRRLVVDDATQPGCPIVDAAFTRHHRDDNARATSVCKNRGRAWLEHAKRFRPDLVLVVSSLEDAGDHANERNGFWANVALLGLYQQAVRDYRLAARTLRSTGAVVAWADVPTYTFAAHPAVRTNEYLDARVQGLNGVITEVTPGELGVVSLDYASHLDRPDGSIDLRQRPDGIHLSLAAAVRAAHDWLDRELLAAYADAEREIGVDVGATAVRVLVTGDSTSLSIAAGLGNHGRVHGDVVVDWAGQIACPLAHAQAMRGFADGRIVPVSGCKSFPSLWKEHLRSFRPDVVLVVSSLIDASDLDFGHGWQHIGDSRCEARYRAAMHNAISEFRRNGVKVLWASAPREELPTASATRDLEQRLHRLNAIIASMTKGRPGVRELPLAAHVDGENGRVDLGARPDGVHFTIPAATRIADDWLAAAIVAANSDTS